jgi:DNA-directed RNA polymerase specialized sigma subunit
MEGGKLKEIGESYGINESRASQICSDTLRKLRAAA